MFLSNIKKKIKKKLTIQTPSILSSEKNNIFRKYKNTDNTSLFFFGDKNPDKTFYVIKRTPGAGLFSNLLFALNHVIKARKKGYIPFVDMQNFPTIYNENHKIFNTNNSWEYYFENFCNYKLDDIYKSKNVYITSNDFEENFEKDLISDNIKNEFRKNIIVKRNHINIVNFYEKKYFNDFKILGVHFRGTSYKKSPGHPFPATKKQMLNIINQILKENNYDKIFLVTEEKDYKNFLYKRFKNKMIYINSPYRSNKNDAFKIYPRKRHRYKLGREALIESILLSKCDALIHVTSNITSAAIAWNHNKSQIRYHINNGFNSKNIILSQFLWYLKKILPKNFGGFKNIIIEK